MDLSDLKRQLFMEARTHRSFSSKEIEDSKLHEIYNLAKFGPTANNYCPMRVTFIKSPEAKQKLIEVASEGNQPKIKSAPVTIIIAYDLKYYQHIHLLAPHMDASKVENQSEKERDKFARELSFNKTLTDEVFYSGTSWRSNILINLGYGDHKTLRPRAPRIDFEHACQII